MTGADDETTDERAEDETEVETTGTEEATEANGTTETEETTEKAVQTEAAETEQKSETNAETKAEKILQAEKEIRREGAKAAFLHGTVEATMAFVVVFFVLSAFQPALVPEAVGAVSGEVAIAAVAAVLFFAADTAFVYRRRTLEQFEDVNPRIDEALRTARDAAERGEESVMAEALYDDVLEELRNTSSEGFVKLPRIAGSVVIVVAAAFLLLTFSFGGAGGIGDGLFQQEVDGPGEGEGEGGGGGEGNGEDDGDGEDEGIEPDDVLADESGLSGGDGDEVAIDLSGVAEEGEANGGTTGSSGGGSDFTGDVEVEGQRAEFEEGEEIEDADLVKEYNLRIRNGD